MAVDADRTVAALSALTGRLDAAARAIAEKGALIVQREGMDLTHVVTGTLRRSWRVEPAKGEGGVYAARVGPTMIYARRQELGFLPPLQDSLGRSFPNDPGWPYVRPAREKAKAAVEVMARRTVGEAISARGGET